MGNGLKPDLFIESIEKLDINLLKKSGIKGLLLDIDNTLITHAQNVPDIKIKKFLENLNKNGIKTAIVSNASKKRAEHFGKELNIHVQYRAQKPSVVGFNRALNKLGLNNSEAAVVGDQIFTDIKGGNKAGLFTILVKPLDKHEPYYVKLKRIPEKIIIKLYNLGGNNG